MIDASELDTFLAEIIECRDAAIDSVAMNVHSNTKGTTRGRWAAALLGLSDAAVLGVLIPDAVDETIFRLLLAIDNGDLELFVRDTSGAIVSLADLGGGNLAGKYIDDEDGWRVTYSHRPAHPFA